MPPSTRCMNKSRSTSSSVKRVPSVNSTRRLLLPRLGQRSVRVEVGHVLEEHLPVGRQKRLDLEGLWIGVAPRENLDPVNQLACRRRLLRRPDRGLAHTLEGPDRRVHQSLVDFDGRLADVVLEDDVGQLLRLFGEAQADVDAAAEEGLGQALLAVAGDEVDGARAALLDRDGAAKALFVFTKR